MEDSVIPFLQKTLQRIPSSSLKSILNEWGFLSAQQLQDLHFQQSKHILQNKVLAFCEDNGMRIRHVIQLDMIYNREYPNKRNWSVYQLSGRQDDALILNVTEFSQKFKINLKDLLRHVSIGMKQCEDDAVWIRVAWGDNFTKPNQFKPTYIVYQLHTPYVFISNLNVKHRPLVSQALVIATKHDEIKEIQLRGRSLKSLKDLVLRRYKQSFQTHQPKTLQERDSSERDQGIDNEHAKRLADLKEVATQTFGEGPLPKLETAVFKLETKFKDPENRILTNRPEPFRCAVKFSSPSFLESIKSLVTLGIASAPVSPLLSSIPQKSRNHFVISERGPGIPTPGP
ncbi:centromere protein N-like isoform X2 [Polyodon spathula]|uniref:centromere protein N-like isoform X2 n=1 Tax=Polyodon spathula TaxID=7913 RepID=UPI001B7F631E|nr:centromere protein N-like isoform X2 [Polyodon spathula]